jgi:hypothetical protein
MILFPVRNPTITLGVTVRHKHNPSWRGYWGKSTLECGVLNTTESIQSSQGSQEEWWSKWQWRLQTKGPVALGHLSTPQKQIQLFLFEIFSIKLLGNSHGMLLGQEEKRKSMLVEHHHDIWNVTKASFSFVSLLSIAAVCERSWLNAGCVWVGWGHSSWSGTARYWNLLVTIAAINHAHWDSGTQFTFPGRRYALLH